MKYTDTYTATIYMGLKPSYSGVNETYLLTAKRKALNIIQDYCDNVGLGVTVTDTLFVYTEGNEPGLIIGLINYPRFPSEDYEIRSKAY